MTRFNIKRVDRGRDYLLISFSRRFFFPRLARPLVNADDEEGSEEPAALGVRPAPPASRSNPTPHPIPSPRSLPD